MTRAEALERLVKAVEDSNELLGMFVGTEENQEGMVGEQIKQNREALAAALAEKDAEIGRLNRDRTAILHHNVSLRDELGRVRAQHATPIPEGYACGRCGRRDGLDAVATDDVWEKIREAADGKNILCLWCMDAVAAELGISGTVSLHFAGRALAGTSQSAADSEHISRLAGERDALDKVRKTAQALIDDVKRRYPGEELRCPFMRDLDAALAAGKGE